MAIYYLNDWLQRDYLKQYPTFRYHSSGPAYFTNDGYDQGLPGGAPNALRVGLRNTAGTQITLSGQLGQGTRYQFIANGSWTIPAGSYALNMRAVWPGTPAPDAHWYGRLEL
jgi:hypothetical protein